MTQKRRGYGGECLTLWGCRVLLLNHSTVFRKGGHHAQITAVRIPVIHGDGVSRNPDLFCRMCACGTPSFPLVSLVTFLVGGVCHRRSAPAFLFFALSATIYYNEKTSLWC
jgi:hypothetical protein